MPDVDVIDSAFTNLLLLVAGAVGLWRARRELALARASLAWPRVHGEIAESAKRFDGRYENGDAMWRTVITYRYAVGGATYQGARVFFGDQIALRFAGPGKRRLAVYPAGRAVEVAYDPRNPRRAVLEPGVHQAAYLASVVSAGAALLGLAGLLRPATGG